MRDEYHLTDFFRALAEAPPEGVTKIALAEAMGYDPTNATKAVAAQVKVASRLERAAQAVGYRLLAQHFEAAPERFPVPTLGLVLDMLTEDDAYPYVADVLERTGHPEVAAQIRQLELDVTAAGERGDKETVNRLTDRQRDLVVRYWPNAIL